MLLDCHGVGGKGQGGGVVGGNQDWGEDDNRKLGCVWFKMADSIKLTCASILLTQKNYYICEDDIFSIVKSNPT